jgi:phage N-6-adenine-methyltransferase
LRPPDDDGSLSIFSRISRQDQKDLRQCWRTHPEVFEALDRIFRFTIDACASKANALLPRYWTAAQDAFAQDWRGERVFCNPPFRLSRQAMEKGPSARLAVIITCVTTLSNRYLHERRPDHVFFPERRMKFLRPHGLVGPTTNPLPCVVMLYGARESHLKQLRRLGSVYRCAAT